MLLEGLDHGGGLLGGGGNGDWDARHHRVLRLQFGGRARLWHCVRAVPKAGGAGKPQGLEPPEDGVVEDVAGLLQHQQLTQRSARTFPLCNVHRKHHLLWLRLFTLNLKIVRVQERLQSRDDNSNFAPNVCQF